jgi:HK97 family phage major capsid protein
VPGAVPFPGQIIGYRKNGSPIRLLAGGDLTNDLTGQLETRRASLVTANRELLTAAAAANEGNGRDLTADEEKRYQDNRGEVEKLKQRISDLSEETAREQRAAAARADGTTTVVDSGQGATGVQVTREPVTYERYSPHSYFADMLRATQKTGDGDGGPQAAEQRLNRHRAEMDVELPKRREQRARAASRILESHTQERLAALPSGVRRREERSVERFLGIGVPTFETRAINQTQGTGGYFVPPLWLVDEYVAYLRAGRVTANLCHSMPLPPGTNSINLPIITTGTATGIQSADGTALTSSPGVTDIADNYVNALVRTTAGQEDASMQLLDLSPVGIDQIIFRDLSADYAQNLDGQVLLGSGSSGQMTGMYPQGTITGGSTPGVIVNTVTGTTTAQWVGTNSFYAGMGKLLSQISRLRYANVSAVVTNPAVWYAMATAADGNSRPLVVPSIQGPFNAAADMDSPNYEGIVGNILGRPWYVDNNIPLTFGGATTNPSIAKSAGHVAPTDGTGSGNTFTPAIAAAWDDLLLFEGEVRTRVLQEVLSGALQVRFQIYGYNAFIANRYQGASAQIVSYGNANSGTTAGAALSTGSSGGLVGF